MTNANTDPLRTKFHISHIIPDLPRDWNRLYGLHGLHGYADIIESIRWGLTSLGHDVSSDKNTAARDRVNIIFGFQLLNESIIDAFPPDTIVYNLERLNEEILQASGAYRAAARRLHIWEYSERNMENWRGLNPVFAPVHVPVGWAPVLARIPKAELQDIDVLLYGHPSDSRFHTFARICAKGMCGVFVCGLYGPARDALISRAKIVLNINRHEMGLGILEVARISYLLANSKAVVADIDPDIFVEPDLRDAVCFVSLEKIADACTLLLDSESERLQLEKRGEEIMRRRDIRQILSRALDASGFNTLPAR